MILTTIIKLCLHFDFIVTDWIIGLFLCIKQRKNTDQLIAVFFLHVIYTKCFPAMLYCRIRVDKEIINMKHSFTIK